VKAKKKFKKKSNIESCDRHKTTLPGYHACKKSKRQNIINDFSATRNESCEKSKIEINLNITQGGRVHEYH
jgi:hypothetical protein